MARYITEKGKAELYERFVEARLTGPKESADWFEVVAGEYGVKWSEVRRWIAEMDDMHRAANEDAAATSAQRIANLQGASRADAIRALREALVADSSKVIHDRDGNVLDTLTFPDHQARIAAAKELLKLTGSYPAEKHEITDPNDELSRLSDADLTEKLAELRTQRNSEGALPAAGAESKAGNKGRLLLAPVLHKDS